MNFNRNLFYFFWICYTLVFVALIQIWYSSQFVSHFHWFNDSQQWLGLDKLGHSISSFYLTCMYFFFIDKEKNNTTFQIIFKSSIGFWLLLPVEIADGFSINYGASCFDLLANFLGSIFAIFVLQLNDIKYINLFKFSFSPTSFPTLRPELLGNTFIEQIIKDYNGQTYWLTLNLEFLNQKIIPSWLQICIGYGANGLLGGNDNIWTKSGVEINKSTIKREPSIFFSFDINFIKIFPALKRWKVFYILQFFKTPLPTLEFSFQKGFFWHWIYF